MQRDSKEARMQVPAADALALLKASLSRAQEAKPLLAWGPEEAGYSSITGSHQQCFSWKMKEEPVSQGPQADRMN